MTEQTPVQGPSGGRLGVVAIVIASVGLAIVPIWTFPATTASSAQVAGFLAAHQAGLEAMMLCYTIAVSLWLVFAAAVWARLRAASAEQTWLPHAFAAGAIGFVVLLLAGFTAFDVAVYRPDAATARLLYDLAFGLLAMSGLPTAIALGSYALTVYRTRCLARRSADLASVTAAAHLLLLASFVVPSGFFSLEGLVIAAIPALLWAWILLTALSMARRACLPATRPGRPWSATRRA